MLKRFSENSYLNTLIVAGAAIFTFFPTVENFFYLDEWGNLYEWTHGYPYVSAIFTVNIFRFLFDTFYLNSTGYFVAALTVYTASVVIFYLFVARLLNNKVLGLVAGLLYATSPIGITTTTMVWTYVAEGGYPLTVMLLMLLYLFWRYFTEKKKIYLIAGFFAFMLFNELEPRRAFMFFPILVLFDYMFNHVKKILSLGFIARTVALFALFVSYYKYDVSLTKIFATGKIIFSEAASTFDWHTKLILGRDSLTDPRPLITLTNILLAGPWIFISERLAGYVDLADINEIRFLVITTLVVVLSLIVVAWKVKREWGQILLFSLGWVHINVLGIYIFSSPGVSEAVHRTLSLAAPGYALFVTVSGAALYTFLTRRTKIADPTLKRIFIFAFLLILTGNFLATRSNFEKFNAFHSRPARAFFSDLKRYYPTLPENPLIYIDTPNDARTKYVLSRIYGGNNYGASATMAVFYPGRTKEDVVVARDLVTVEKFTGTDKAKIDRVFAFYFDSNGLRDTTSDIRKELQNKK
ncbi:MAG: hypothetical protein G01um10145_900 [Microgenomates group bacterium Gr01-1014_5]|nr:MAG: hypothetical protein G01um10145_900 [Microgenomates group bacterium Gr01-1014_5]